MKADEGVEFSVNTDFQNTRSAISAGGLIKPHATNNKLRTKPAAAVLPKIAFESYNFTSDNRVFIRGTVAPRDAALQHFNTPDCPLEEGMCAYAAYLRCFMAREPPGKSINWFTDTRGYKK